MIGPSKRRIKPNFGQEMKALAKACGKDVLPEVKLPRPYKPRPNARHSHNMEEKKIEKRIIKYLRGRGFKCGKTDPAVGGWNVGTPDIQCWASAFWLIEVKTSTGRQSKEQKEFQAMCERTGINYVLARGIEDVKHIK